jgi:hypothetical protein
MVFRLSVRREVISPMSRKAPHAKPMLPQKPEFTAVDYEQFVRHFNSAVVNTALHGAASFRFIIQCPKLGGTLAFLDNAATRVTCKLSDARFIEDGRRAMSWGWTIDADTALDRMEDMLDWMMGRIWQQQLADGTIGVADGTALRIWTEYRTPPFRPMTGNDHERLFGDPRRARFVQQWFNEGLSDEGEPPANPHP